MGRTIRRLRADGQLAAVVDLAQIATRSDSGESGRWHYSIAYRICRELRLKVDLQDWWQERKLLPSDQRLVDFFWDVVLANSEGGVTVFFDEAEHVIDEPFSSELFAALHSVYTRRVSEPEFARLNFVVLGVATPEQLCPDSSVSPFVTGQAIRLEEFTLEECFVLASGFQQEDVLAREVIAQIFSWTHGQPYLTQKVARAIARKGCRPEDLEVTLQELFLGSRIRLEESYLSHMRSLLTDGSVRGRQAVAMLHRLNKGQELIDDPRSPAQKLLRLGGFVSSDENGMIRFRSRIVEQVFDRASTATMSSGVWPPRPAGAAAFAAGLFVVLALWYFLILPRPYIDTLELVSNDYVLAEQAHRRLSALPGFGGRADRMLTDIMVRRSQEAETVDEVRAADTALRRLPNREALADELLAGFRLRQAEAAAQRGDRDEALTHTLAAMAAGSSAARNLASVLIDGDYPLLDQSFHFDLPLVDFAVDWVRGRVIAVDELNRLYRLPFAGSDEEAVNGFAIVPRPASLELTALEHVGVTRDLFVDEPGIAGDLQLRVSVDHPRTGDLLVRLRAPSGVAAEIPLPERGGGNEQFVFSAATTGVLNRLARESMTGQWELTVFDRLGGESGRLLGWNLSFPGVSQYWDDETNDGIALPDPAWTSQVMIALAPDGRRAVAIPSQPDARGAASVWDLGSGSISAHLPLADRINSAVFLSDQRFLVGGPMRVSLWDAAGASLIAEIATENSTLPIRTRDGSVFALAEAGNDRMRVSLYRSDDGELIDRFDADPFVDWAISANAALLATVDGSRRGSLIDAATGSLSTEFFHEQPLERVFFVQDRLVAVDWQGEVLTWAPSTTRRTLAPGDSIYLGRTANADSFAVFGKDGVVSFVDPDGVVVVSRLEDGRRLGSYGHGSGAPVGSGSDPAGQNLVSAVGQTLRLWRVPASRQESGSFGDVSSILLAADGESAIVGFRDGQVRVLDQLSSDMPEDPPESPYFAHRGVVTSLAMDAVFDRAASGGTDGVIRVWDLATESTRRELMRHASGPINALAFSPDGRYLASGGPGSARIFDVETGSPVHEIPVDGDALALDFSPDSLTVAVGDSGGNIHLESPDGLQGRFTIRGRSAITALAFVGAADVLASGSGDGNLVLWDTLEGSVIGGARRFGGPIRRISSADGGAVLISQSGSWIYALDRNSGLVTAAGLLPAALRSNASLAAMGTGGFRVLANAGGGGLMLDEISLATSGRIATGDDVGGSGPPLPDSIDDLIARRDWGIVLGLELDDGSGEIRRLAP